MCSFHPLPVCRARFQHTLLLSVSPCAAHKGWQCDISKARTFEQLPAAAQTYLKRIEELTGVPVSWVGVGAARDDMATQGFKI